MGGTDGKSGKSCFHQFEVFLNTINHVLIGFVAIYITWHCFTKGLTTVPLHAWLCTIGFQLLMAEALMCFYPANAWTSEIPIRMKRAMHWILQLIGSVMGLAGTIVMILHVEGKHFTTIHGILGLSSIVILIISFATGLAAFSSTTIKHIMKPVVTKAIHNFLGFSAFVLALASLFFGYAYLRRQIQPDFLELLKAITVITVVLSLFGPLKSLFRQLKTIVSN